MVAPTNARILLLKTLLKAGEFQVSDRDNEIRVTVEKPDFSRCAVDFYALSKNPEHVRARLASADSGGAQEEAPIEEIRGQLQKPLFGEARIEPFCCQNTCRGIRIYYACVELEKDIDEFANRLRGVEEAIDELNRLGAGGFREILDRLDLPRSSIIRMALNRIFRDADAPDDLMAAIAKEARVIVSNKDWKALRQLKEESRLPPSLRLISHLLWEETSRRYMIQAWEDLHK